MTGQYEPQPADEDVGERVYYRVTVVTERGGLFTVTPDNELRVLDHFPKGFDGDRKPEPPDRRQPPGHQRQQPAQGEAVEHVGEAVRIQQVLRVVRTPGVA